MKPKFEMICINLGDESRGASCSFFMDPRNCVWRGRRTLLEESDSEESPTRQYLTSIMQDEAGLVSHHLRQVMGKDHIN